MSSSPRAASVATVSPTRAIQARMGSTATLNAAAPQQPATQLLSHELTTRRTRPRRIVERPPMWRRFQALAFEVPQTLVPDWQPIRTVARATLPGLSQGLEKPAELVLPCVYRTSSGSCASVSPPRTFELHSKGSESACRSHTVVASEYRYGGGNELVARSLFSRLRIDGVRFGCMRTHQLRPDLTG